MSPTIVRRSATLAALLILVSAVAVAADTVVPGDGVLPIVQGTLDLGQTSPGGQVSVDLPFTLSCKNGTHVARGAVLQVQLDSKSVPLDGTLSVGAAEFPEVPQDWPLNGAFCPGVGQPSLLTTTPSHVVLTAPSTPGTDYLFDVIYAVVPPDAISNTTAISFKLDVVDVTPPDTTDPVLGPLPADVDVVTDNPTGAVVTFANPSATDDTDPAPVVDCSPASGSTFAPGSTTVTCTATDASGNSSSGTFVVRVHLAGVAWDSPLVASTPAIVANLGRTIPLKASLTVEGAAWTPSSGAAPGLRLARLNGCSAGAAALETRDLGAMIWDSGRWTRNLDTSGMSAGCWRVSLVVGSTGVGDAVLSLVNSPVGQKANAIRRRR